MILLKQITTMEIDYTVTTAKDFPVAVTAVEEEIDKVGMRVLYVHDVQAALAEKGFTRGPFKIIEFCNAKYASAFLEADAKIGLCMPCKINVYTDNGQTIISGLRPILLTQFFPEADLGNKPAEIDALIQQIINRAK